MRNLARDAMLGCGARGFMRFAPSGDALLVCDAALRCADGGLALEQALEAAGFVLRREKGMLLIWPGDALLDRLCARESGARIDWAGGLYPAQAFAARLLRAERMPLSAAGRSLVMETARLLWQPQSRVLAGLHALRAQAAAHLRAGDCSGFAHAGALLANWCDEAESRRAR